MMVLLNAQEYTLVRGTFSTTGGFQSVSVYSGTTAVGNYSQGNAQTTSNSAYLGFLFPELHQNPPDITSIDDVPNDQGLQVQVVWNKCAFDRVYSIDTFYSVWRQDEDFDLILSDVNETDHELPDNIFADPNEIIQLTEIQQENSYWLSDDLLWTFLETVPALQYDEYSYIAPTLIDSNSTSENLSTFKVVYHAPFQYYESLPDSGYSVDNIPPDATEAVRISMNADSITLDWDEVTSGTFAGNSYPELTGVWYKIYAGNSPNFICDEEHYLAIVEDLEYSFPLSENSMFFKIIVDDESE
ncbi:MAG: hypothetical protein K9N39_11935 [Candidatus Cloacimonetes bacterium]|nr:hypothetical protein [Candidatus Cloacimonadota bacterium]